LCLVLLTFIVTGTAHSQDSTARYKKIDYIHVSPDQLSSFIDEAKGSLKEAYQQLVDEGKLHGWQLYYVEYPGGERSQYNLVSVASASDLTAFEKLFTAIDDRGYIPSTAGKSA